VFKSTLEMITQNFQDFPDMRSEFFNFLLSLIKHCFAVVKALNNEVFELIIHSIVWAFKHTMRNISEIGLGTLTALLNSIHHDSNEVRNIFYKGFFINLLQDILVVLTDTMHKSDFSNHCQIVKDMLTVIEMGGLTIPIWDTNIITDTSMTNQRFVREHIINLLIKAFPNLSKNQVLEFVTKLCNLCNPKFSLADFKIHFRDFFS